MKVQITVAKLGNRALGVATLRFSGVKSNKIYEQPFSGHIHCEPAYQAIIHFPEDVAFFSATCNSEFDFTLESMPESAEAQFYA